MKADVAVRRLESLEKENSQLEDEECEASLPDAAADKTKVVKLVVDKWFFDKGFGFGRVPTGDVVFIHASVVRTAEVLTLGTDAWVQIVYDDVRAQAVRTRRVKERERAEWHSKSDERRADSKVGEGFRDVPTLHLNDEPGRTAGHWQPLLCRQKSSSSELLQQLQKVS